MDNRFIHRGVTFSIKKISDRRWHWEVMPPKSVVGMNYQQGEVLGDEMGAFHVAKAQIDLQALAVGLSRSEDTEKKPPNVVADPSIDLRPQSKPSRYHPSVGKIRHYVQNLSKDDREIF